MKEQIKKYILDIWKTKSKRWTAVAYLVAPFVCAMLVDFFNRRSIVQSLKGIAEAPVTFIINAMIILFTMSIGLLCKKRLAFIVSVFALWLGLGVANYVIMSMRESPFSATDLKLLGDIDNIIEVYLSPLSLILIIVAIMLVVVGVSIMWVKLPKYAEKINYLKNLLIIGVVFLVTLGAVRIGLMTDNLSEKFPNMTEAYYNYGFPYCFSTSIVNTGVSQPEEYSKDNVEDILDKMESTSTVDEDNVLTPNIIFLQLESFFDVTKFEGLELSAEATPVFNKLKEDYPSGYLTVNNVGYGTANTEFEIMTGLNLDDFGPGEFPYNTILTKTTCESTAYILKEHGYMAHALHNNTATFYSRNTVFKRLGFDTFTSIEYMYPEEYTVTEWSKDIVLAEEIMKVLKSTEDTDYVYAISVQGHGAYPTEPVLIEPAIEVVGGIEDEERKYMFEYYVNMIAEMDTFVGELVKQLSEYGEDTVLVIYGDHLPSLEITRDELTNEDLYQTEYVVWNNINLDMEDKDIETFQLSSRVLQHLNIDNGYINKFHQTFGDKKDYLDKLHILSYDILYGNMFAYDGINPYIATDMQMGTNEIVINQVDNATYKDLAENLPEWEERIHEILPFPDTDIDNPAGLDEDTTDKDTDNDDTDSDTVGDDIESGNGNTSVLPNPDDKVSQWYIVTGENFTECSYVYVNGEECETIYIDEARLLVNVQELSTLDIFVVKQKADATELSSSHEFTYFFIDNPDEDGENKDDVSIFE